MVLRMRELTYRRGTLMYEATRQIITCTVRQIQNELSKKYQLDVSLGKVMKYKPFFMAYHNEKERIICMWCLFKYSPVI